MRYITFIVFAALALQGVGQTELKPSIVKSLFKESADTRYEGHQAWVACDQDSSYWKQDTVYLFNRSGVMYHTKCKKYVYWQFENGKQFSLHTIDEQKEPPLMTSSPAHAKLKAILKKVDNKLVLEVKNASQTTEKFHIVKMDAEEIWAGGEKAHRLTMYRLN